jgi:hypothetical protein
MKQMMFGFAAVNAGQRNVSVEPQVIVTSTEGGFRLTAPATRALGIAAGDNVMFINNVDAIDAAIATRAEEVVAFCEEQGLELGTPEALIAIHKAYDMWAVAKGIEEFDGKGNHKSTTERLTKKDKVKFATAHFDEMYDAAMQSDKQEVIDALTREDITRDEQIEILTQFVIGREIVKVKGSKTANAAGLTGTGLTLNFTDSNVWKQLKSDLHDAADTVNRVYELDLDNVQDVVISNGFEDVTVKALILGDYTDKAPARAGEAEVEE